MEIKLSERLLAIASLVPEGSVAADVGTDHGYVPIWLVEKGICPSAIAMDVRKGPLERAKDHVREAGLSGRIDLRLSDGLEKLLPGEADAIVIAGMGGGLMVRILEAGAAVFASWEAGKQRLILSPQSEPELVRHFLEDHGFSIYRERMVMEDGKYYVILEAGRGTMRLERDFCYIYGRYLIEKKDPVLRAYLEREKRMTSELIKTLSDTIRATAVQASQEVNAAAGIRGGERAVERKRELEEKYRMIEEAEYEMQ
ncbi:MAG: tRNA (adenine(22)-N(1))-methyltransferase [Clostridium sp.]|jgi:tRNA (adenine22-N1)-methyltransferase